MRKINKPLAAIFVAASALSLTACAKTLPAAANAANVSVDNKAASTIQVQSTEEVKVTPDMAEINFAVSTQEADPKAAQEKNSQDLNKVIEFLKQSGVDETSIQTSNYGLSPIYDYTSGQKITGYQMRTSILVSNLPIDKVGTLVSSSIAAGINNIDSISYLSSKYDESYQEALKKAIESSKVKAEAIAAASGTSLGGIFHIEEVSTYNNTRYVGYTAAESAAQGNPKSMVVEPGQLNVQAQVTVSYKIK
ncbi:SIMPL domain-containing protein [Lacrimispora sp. JR3]|uniref:SIMPL domain-containing protein n=1 Tax=Lacrimispora sinapis TaxID=3111456 RepID=UPI00374826D8